jgi:hypothetical protein
MNAPFGSVGFKLQGFYKVAIVDVDGTVVWSMDDWHKNLILNTGMDALASFYFAQLTQNAVAGNGDRDNSISSGDSQASAIGGMVYLYPSGSGLQNFSGSITNGHSASLFSGDIIKFADGTEVRATGSIEFRPVLGDLSASIASNASIATQSFTIWKTAQLGLHREVRRAGLNVSTSSFLNGINWTTASVESASAVYFRTYDFGPEVTPVTYSEVGAAWAATAQQSSSVFSRVKLPTGIPLMINQRLRLSYGLMITFGPTASFSQSNATVHGWPVAPATNTNIVSQSLQSFSYGLAGAISSIGPSGIAENIGYASLEPNSGAANCYIWGSTHSGSLTAFGATPVNRASNGHIVVQKDATKITYNPGEYCLYKYAQFTLSELNYTNLSSFGFGSYYTTFGFDLFPYYTSCVYAMVFEQTHSKANTQTLTMGFKWAWSRQLG